MNYLLHKSNKNGDTDAIAPAPTFATVGGDLSKGVVAAVALASDHARFALALAVVPVASPGEGAQRVAVAQQAAVAALGTVVVVLEANAEEELSDRASHQPLQHISGHAHNWGYLALSSTFSFFYTFPLDNTI